MKIRTDFVTNSSSSSFTLLLRIELKNGKTLKWKGSAYEEDEIYSELYATLSPKKLARSRDTASLVKKLKEAVECEGEMVLDETSKFIQDAAKIPSMRDIAKISVDGVENYDIVNQWGQFFAYDCETKQYTCKFHGEEWGNIGGASGGSLYVPDSGEAETIEFELQKGVYRYCGRGKAEVVVPADRGITKIGDFAFCNHGTIEHVTLPQGIKTIGNYAFHRTSLTRIDLPAGLKKIGESAFAVTELQHIDVPEGVKEIGPYAFEDCTQLTRVTIPASVTKIGACAFPTGRNKPTICAPAGSFAQTYAEENDLPFEAL